MKLPDPDGGGEATRPNLVDVREETVPVGTERLERFLLTTLAVASRQEALRVLEWYRLRSRDGAWHGVLKSGSKVEDLGPRREGRIDRAVTINVVIAWRLTAMKFMGRETLELPATALFSKIEIAALEEFRRDHRLASPDNFGRAVLTLAMLGGYLHFKRKRYAVPVHQVMWEGYTRLATITQAFERARRLNESSELYPNLRRDKTCV